MWCVHSGMHELQCGLHSFVPSDSERSMTVGGRLRVNCNSQSGTVQVRQLVFVASALRYCRIVYIDSTKFKESLHPKEMKLTVIDRDGGGGGRHSGRVAF